MLGDKKTTIPRQSSYNSLYLNPLNDLRHARSCSDGGGFRQGKENLTPNTKDEKEKAIPTINNGKKFGDLKALKASSLHVCMQMNEGDKVFASKLWDGTDSEHSSSLKIWDFSDSEAAPASSWSTLPNRSLSFLCSMFFFFTFISISNQILWEWKTLSSQLRLTSQWSSSSYE